MKRVIKCSQLNLDSTVQVEFNSDEYNKMYKNIANNLGDTFSISEDRDYAFCICVVDTVNQVAYFNIDEVSPLYVAHTKSEYEKWKSAVENALGNRLLFITKFVDTIHGFEDDATVDRLVAKLYRKLRSILPESIKLRSVTSKQISGPDVGVDVADSESCKIMPVALSIDAHSVYYDSMYNNIVCPPDFSTQDLNDIVNILIDLGFNI